MSSRASITRGRHDPLLAAFVADECEGLTVRAIARKHGTYRERVARALISQAGRRFNSRRDQLATACAAVEVIHSTRRVDPAPRLAAGTCAAIHALRAHARIDGPAPADETRIAAAHAAGLTLDDIHEVFAVPPREAVRAIAAHAGR